MKTLQNNFTTLEQSKRLLELGVPANSADLLYHEGVRLNLERGMFLSTLEGYENFDKAVIGFRKYYSDKDMKVVPCWSVGRLIEIIGTCANIDSFEVKCSNSIDDIISVIEHDIVYEQELNFSKLED